MSETEKEMVQQYREANRALRRQLEALSDRIDTLIQQKASKLGLKKLPAIQKEHTSAKVIHHEVENLRKKLQYLVRDDEVYRQKAGENYSEKIEHLKRELTAKGNSTLTPATAKDQLKKQLKECYYLAKKAADLAPPHDHAPDALSALKIIKLTEELATQKAIERALIQDINHHSLTQAKTLQKLNQLTEKLEDKHKADAPIVKDQQPRQEPNEDIEENWKQLKRRFLELKESNQREEQTLNEENATLRKKIRSLETKIKTKKARIEIVAHAAEAKFKDRQRQFSTLEEPRPGRYRYRSKNNSIIGSVEVK